jgi:hypothetical protein
MDHQAIGLDFSGDIYKDEAMGIAVQTGANVRLF